MQLLGRNRARHTGYVLFCDTLPFAETPRQREYGWLERGLYEPLRRWSYFDFTMNRAGSRFISRAISFDVDAGFATPNVTKVCRLQGCSVSTA